MRTLGLKKNLLWQKPAYSKKTPFILLAWWRLTYAETAMIATLLVQ